MPYSKNTKSLNHSPTKSIVSINSSRYRNYEEMYEYENKETIDAPIDGSNRAMRTIDYPEPVKEGGYQSGRKLKK